MTVKRIGGVEEGERERERGRERERENSNSLILRDSSVRERGREKETDRQTDRETEKERVLACSPLLVFKHFGSLRSHASSNFD